MINLKYTYQPSKNLDEVNKQVTNLVELLKNELLQAATNENVESLVMKVEQTSDDGAKRLAEVNARVGETAAVVGMMASYNSATGKITVEAGLKAGIEESNIVLSGDHIILDGDVTIQNGFKLSGDHITSLTIDASQITSGLIKANRIDVSTISIQQLVNNYGSQITFYSGIYIPCEYQGGTYETSIGSGGIWTPYGSFIEAAARNLKVVNINNTNGLDINVYGLTRVNNGLKVSDHLESFGTTYLNGTVFSHGINQAAIQSGVANVRIETDTDLMKAIGGSSKRYKHDIRPLEKKLDAHKLYDISVIQFVYNEDYIDKDDQRNNEPIPGFIAEDIKEKYPIACDVNKKGQAETWNERIIIPPMLALIQEQNKRIKRLEEAYAGDN